MAGRPPGSPNKDKPFKKALGLEAASAEQGEECFAPKGSLRWIARRLLERAGDETQAAKEVADRMDGKVPQTHGQDDESGPQQFMIVTGVDRADDPV